MVPIQDAILQMQDELNREEVLVIGILATLGS